MPGKYRTFSKVDERWVKPVDTATKVGPKKTAVKVKKTMAKKSKVPPPRPIIPKLIPTRMPES